MPPRKRKAPEGVEEVVQFAPTEPATLAIIKEAAVVQPSSVADFVAEKINNFETCIRTLIKRLSSGQELASRELLLTQQCARLRTWPIFCMFAKRLYESARSNDEIIDSVLDEYGVEGIVDEDRQRIGRYIMCFKRVYEVHVLPNRHA